MSEAVNAVEGLNAPVVVPEAPAEDGVELLLEEPWEQRQHPARHARKRSKQQRDEDLIVIAEQLHKKKTIPQIADHLNSIRQYYLSREQIKYDIRQLEERWKLKNNATIASYRTKQLEYIETLEAEAMEAWAASKADEVSQQRETTPNKRGEDTVSKTVVKRVKRYGDVGIINTLITLHQERCKLLGLYAASKTEVEVSGSVQHGGMDIQALRNNFKRKIANELAEQETKQLTA